MARLLIHVEGPTEEMFVKEVLKGYLTGRGYSDISPRILGKARLRGRRGGIVGWPTARKDILGHLKEDLTCIATTMVDYYGLPQTEDNGWPGRKNTERSVIARAQSVERELLNDVVAEMGKLFNPTRFVPFVLMHEFEGLLFSDCTALSRAFCRPELESDFQSIRNGFATPEEIDDHAPSSERISELLPGMYEKPLLGNLAVLEIGLDRIRSECPHFNDWLKRLESAASGR